MTFILVFRQGDIGTNWYAVLNGTLEVFLSKSGLIEVSVVKYYLFSLTSWGLLTHIFLMDV